MGCDNSADLVGQPPLPPKWIITRISLSHVAGRVATLSDSSPTRPLADCSAGEG